MIWGNVSAEEKDIKIRVYGHVYNENKNTPIKNMSVYIKKDGKILWNWKSSKEWLYDIIIDNRTDYLNVCIESNSFTEIKNSNYCVTVSAFQKIGRIINDIEVREVEYDFYTNSQWENLNERYEEEVTNQSTEEAFDEYQETILQEREKDEERIAEEERLAELEKQKAEYKMVANTEMTWPLDVIQIIGTVKSLSGTTQDIDYNRTYIIAIDHYGNKLKEERLNKYYDFNITIHPKNEKVFLHPVNLKIENREYVKIEGENILKYEPEYRLITKEKNIVNVKIREKKVGKMDKTLYVKEKLPILSILFILGFIVISMIVVVKNRINAKRQDY